MRALGVVGVPAARGRRIGDGKRFRWVSSHRGNVVAHGRHSGLGGVPVRGSPRTRVSIDRVGRDHCRECLEEEAHGRRGYPARGRRMFTSPSPWPARSSQFAVRHGAVRRRVSVPAPSLWPPSGRRAAAPIPSRGVAACAFVRCASARCAPALSADRAAVEARRWPAPIRPAQQRSQRPGPRRTWLRQVAAVRAERVSDELLGDGEPGPFDRHTGGALEALQLVGGGVQHGRQLVVMRDCDVAMEPPLA